MNTTVWFCCSVLVFAAGSGASLTPTYQWKDDKTGEAVTCEKCPPGTHMKRHCGRDRRTECAPCPGLHYTEFWNYIDECRYCNVFCTENEFEKRKCSPTHNRLCECRAGFYRRYEFCIRHSVCPAGEGVVANGTAHEDVQCQTCPIGSYSSTPSGTEPCRPHRWCPPGQIAIPGDDKHDTFCSSCKKYGSEEIAKSVEAKRLCDREVMEYVAQQHLSEKKLKRLMTVAKKRTRENATEQEEGTLLSLLDSISKNEHGRDFIEEILFILKKAKLANLEKKVKRWFMER
nr:PREDICTED: tumor necrosis factor receptor superfamily member 6B [Lepisosteus oculatus]